MMLLLNLSLFALALPAVLACGYLLFLTLLSARQAPPACSSRRLRFDVFVPAHNEESVIARTVNNLRRLDWPVDRFRVIVIADNCSDATASIAAQAGARVFERADPERRGKGYALAYAFERSAAESWADAVVVIDADAEASANLLDAFAVRIEHGACAVQAHYGVLNPFASWRTRLITIAKAAFHIVRSRARERLGVSCGIRGNGWCVTHALLGRVPYRAFSLTEDVEYGIELGFAGIRVHYADEAHSDADMVSGEQIARKQRQRWEHGRFQLIRAKTLPLLETALRRRSAVCFDLALDLLVLPLSYVALNVSALIVLAALATWRQPLLQPWLWLGLGCAASLVLYVLRGWHLSGIGARGLLDLARAPGFLLWKLLLMLRRRRSDEWVRTDREKP
jgi:cellulose synthase/poly-beta-1,6-N-acetylglucosamine synthase-like glycosyltransferase